MTGSPRFAVIAGGGTAGHVHPGIALANALVDGGRGRDEILYVGSRRGIEHNLVPAAGFELETLPGRGIPRRVGWQAIKASASLLVGVVRGVALLRRERPRVVVALGGYAAVPCAVGARLCRIPVVVHEQNAVPGAANRLVSRWAAATAVSFERTPLRGAVVTGNPVRPEMLAIDRSTQRQGARDRLGIASGQLMIVVTGGSLGALALNRAAIEAAGRWKDRPDITLYHVIGNRDWDELARDRAGLDAADLDYRPVRYESDMPTVFAAADLVVSRAGASTTAELAVVGLASILVPLPHAPGDHQSANAAALVGAGAAVMVPDAELSGAKMVEVVAGLTSDPNTLDAMSARAGKVGRRDAARRLAALVEEVAR